MNRFRIKHYYTRIKLEKIDVVTLVFLLNSPVKNG